LPKSLRAQRGDPDGNASWNQFRLKKSYTVIRTLKIGMLKFLFLALTITLPSTLWAFGTTSVPTNFDDLTQIDGELIGLDSDGNLYSLHMQAGELESTLISSPEMQTRPDDILQDGLIGFGNKQIQRAWLGGPTTRYDHGVLADSIEASRLYAQINEQTTVYLDLPPDQVFEDRLVRFADLDNDGLDELIVIRTDLNTGAGIASYALENNQLTLKSASENIGLSHRWLNIVGIEDFTGDGKLEIAAVITPHIGGTLTLFQQNGTQLVPIMAQWGFSNHTYGSRELGMSAVADLNADEVMDMAIPNENRRELILLTAGGGQFHILARIKHSVSIKSGIYAADINNDLKQELIYLLKDGTLQIVDL
jgi:hypothetical protein